MNINGGALEFDIIAKNDKIKSTLEETKRCVQTFTSATVAGGEQMETAYAKTAARIEAAFKDIDAMAAIHSNAIEDLQTEYTKLGEQSAAAFMKGTAQGDTEYNALKERQAAIQGEITQRQALLTEVEQTADALYKEEQELQKHKEAVEKNTEHQVSFRTQIRNVREELIQMEQAGQRGTQQYTEMQQELGRLQDAMNDATQQARVLANDQANFQGIITGLSGVTGAFSAAQGAVGLFAGENENLERIMVKVQSLMAITIGLQQISQALNKDSAFMLVTVAQAKQMVAAATSTLNASFVKMGLSATAAKVAVAGLYATLTLGLSLAITAIIAVISKYNEKQEEAKKKSEEFANAISKPLSSIELLSTKYAQLGNDLEAKKTFIDQNKKAFDELGVAVNDVADAENLLINNKDVFIKAQTEKAKATVLAQIAAEKYKEVYEAQQKLDATPKAYVEKKGTYTDGYGTTRESDVVMVKDSGWQKAEDNLKEAKAGYDKILGDMVTAETQWAEIMKGASIEAAGTYAEGTVGAIQQAISEKETALKALSDPAKYADSLKEIEGLKTQLASITGETSKTTGGSEDPFTDQLNERKKLYSQYYKWVNSQDSILQKAANTEFASLLSEGSSYIDYLKTQREQLLALAEKTPEQTENLRKLNDEIANETKNTVLADFDTELQTRLQGAQSVLEMLNILEEKRKALSNDGSDLDNGKNGILDTAQTEVNEQAAEQTKELISHYTEYLTEKLEFEAKYAENSRLLNEQLAKAKTEDEKRIAQEAINGLNKDEAKYSAQTGNEDYDKLVADYKTFQQECADISADYDEKIALASEQKNADLVKKLQEEKTRALSSAASAELQSSTDWSSLLGGNLDEMTTAKIKELIAKLEAQKAQLGIELSPEDLKVVTDKLEAAKSEIETRNPFGTLLSSIKDYDKESKKVSNQKLFEGLDSSLDLIGGAFDSVVSGLQEMGWAGDEVTQDLLSDIGEMVGAAGNLAMGIATGNPLQIIQGGISLLTSAFQVFNTKDRDAERSIAEHAASVKELESAYTALQHAVDNALGEAVYDNQKALIANMREQQVELDAMAREEESKKKSDQSKIDDYEEQYAELGRTIEDTIAEISESITQTSAKDLASQLADAIAETFVDGFNSSSVSAAIESITQQVMQEAVTNALKLQFLEGPLQAAIEQLQKDMGFDEEGGGSFDGLTEAEQAAFKEKVAGIAAGYTEAMKMYEDLFKELDSATDPTTSIAGAIQGASQESIDLLAGQTNAVRVNQVVSIDILRQQLIHLASIDSKMGISNELLSDIYDTIKGGATDPLRAQGITI